MKRKLFGLLAGAALVLTGCYDDSSIVERVDALETEVSNLKQEVIIINTNLSALQTIIDNINSKVYVASVEDVKENGSTIGYTIKFTNGKTVTIYHGQDGERGPAGSTGPKGPEGTPGHTPVMGVSLLDGVYYWTVDGEWLTGEDGKRVPATGPAGAPGSNGSDGITPQIRVNDGNFELSVDNGETWTVLCKATGEVVAVDVVFSGVKETSEGVVFYLADGSKIVAPREQGFSVVVDNSRSYDVVAGSSTEIPYSVVGGDDETVVDAFGSGSWDAEAVAGDAESGVIKVFAPAESESTRGKVLVYATNGKGKTDIKTLTFDKGMLTLVAPASEVPAAGATLTVPVTSNVIFIPQVEKESASWIGLVATKTVETFTENLQIVVEKNNTPSKRTGNVLLVDENGATVQTVSIVQEAGSFTAPVFECDVFKSVCLEKYDTDGDGQLSAAEVEKVTDYSFSDTKAISSYKGIEAFYNLKTFSHKGSEYYQYYPHKSTFTTLDLSQNKKLENVTLCATSCLTLDLRDLPVLASVTANHSKNLTEIKTSNLPELKSLVAYGTSLESLDVTGCPKLETLTTYGTKIPAIDLSSSPEAKSINIGNTSLACLNIQGCNKIESLSISDALIESIDLSALTELKSFTADRAQNLETIDLSKSPKLTSFNASSCPKLKRIDVSSAEHLTSFTASPAVVLLEVRFCEGVNTANFFIPSGNYMPDDSYVPVVKTFVPKAGGDVDVLAAITDEYVRKAILKQYDENGDGALSAAEVAKVKELDLSDYGLKSADELAVFPLETLNLCGNKLTAFDGANFKSLKVLDLSYNELKSVSNLSGLKLTSLDLSHNDITFASSYAYSYLPYMSLKELNVSYNGNMNFSPYNFYYLESVDFSYTATSSLSASSLSAVKSINIAGTKISGTIDVSSLKKLEVLNISETGISEIKISGSVVSGTLKSIIATGSKL
ncbi:MAG: leucine-rich repeat domain-containing protein, partial [Bacteroidales bacterium]|nr:leucine-rich repeat domain-containing protein [Bacteroidales bacterium]